MGWAVNMAGSLPPVLTLRPADVLSTGEKTKATHLQGRPRRQAQARTPAGHGESRQALFAVPVQAADCYTACLRKKMADQYINGNPSHEGPVITSSANSPRPKPSVALRKGSPFEKDTSNSTFT